MKQKAQEEIREELEMQAMGENDPAQQSLKRPMGGHRDESGQASQHGSEDVAYSIGSPTIYDDDETDMSFLMEMENELAGDDSYVPKTPIDHPPPPPPLAQPPSPRQSPTSRAHEDTAGAEESHEARKPELRSERSSALACFENCRRAQSEL